jgi:hypothetical protein
MVPAICHVPHGNETLVMLMTLFAVSDTLEEGKLLIQYPIWVDWGVVEVYDAFDFIQHPSVNDVRANVLIFG